MTTSSFLVKRLYVFVGKEVLRKHNSSCTTVCFHEELSHAAVCNGTSHGNYLHQTKKNYKHIPNLLLNMQ